MNVNAKRRMLVKIGLLYVFTLLWALLPCLAAEWDSDIEIESEQVRFNFEDDSMASDRGVLVRSGEHVLTAQAFVYYQKSNRLEVWGDVKLTGEDVELTAERITADFTRDEMAAETARFESRDARMEAANLVYNLGSKKAEATGGVTMSWDRPATADMKAVAMRLTASDVTFDQEAAVAVATGNVKISSDDMTFSGYTIEAHLDTEELKSRSKVVIVTTGDEPLTLSGGGLDLSLKKNVLLVRGPVKLNMKGEEAISVTGDGDMVYRIDDKELTLEGKVQGRWRCGEISGEGFHLVMTEGGPSWELTGKVKGVILPDSCKPDADTGTDEPVGGESGQ